MSKVISLTQIMLLAMAGFLYQGQTSADGKCTVCKPDSEQEQPADPKEMGRRRR